MRPLMILIFMAMVFPLAGQSVFSFDTMDRKKIESIESAYTAAIDSRPEVKCVFPNQEETVSKRWEALQTSFRDYLTTQKFSFAKSTRFFIRYYFDKDGAVQYVGYKIHAAIDEPTKRAFESHLQNFARQTNFGLIGSTAYTQCGMVSFE